MAFNGSGVFLINSSGQPVVASTLIESAVFNAFTADVATGLSNVICKDGQTVLTANIPMGGFKLTGLAAGSSTGDSVRVSQLQTNSTNWVVAGGTADAITATYSPAIGSLADGQLCFFRATAANATTTPSFSPNGLTARTITMKGGVAVYAGAIPGALAEVILRYNLANTRWELLNPAAAAAIEPVRLPVRVATTANITLSGGAPNTLDGKTLSANDRILVKNQSTASENGIYYVSTLGTGANGTWTRATDADGAGDMFGGMLVAVSEGTANADSIWMLTTNDPITIGTTALTFKSPNLYGTTTNDNAAAGMVGEYVESVVDEASAISLTSTTTINVTSISLTAGDWDVSCNVQFICTATTNITELRGSVSLVSDTLDLTRGRVFDIKTAPHTVISARHGLAGPTLRFSLASTTTIYLVAQGNFTVSTLSAYGIISARRVR